MPSPAGPYKTAEEAALRASAALAAAMGQLAEQMQLFTEVPGNAVVPYLVLGQVQVVVLTDDDCAVEAELVTTINLWSRTRPLDKGAQATAMGSAILDALGVGLAVAGWDVDERTVEDESYVTDPDQSTHGTIVIRFLLTQVTA